MKPRHILPLVLAVLAANASQAATVAITNHSFEAPDIITNLNSSIAITGWTRLSGTEHLADRGVGGTLGSTTDPTPDATDGEQFLLTTSNQGGAYQVTSTAMAAATVYTLTVDIGDRTDQAFPTIDLRIGTGSTFGANLMTATAVSNTSPLNGATATDGWQTWVYTFTGGAGVVGANLRVEMFQTATTSGQALFDNVRLESTLIPEPTSTAILGSLGLLALLRRRR